MGVCCRLLRFKSDFWVVTRSPLRAVMPRFCRVFFLPRQRRALPQAFARICKALGADFAPYLPAVVPPMLAMVSSPLGSELAEDDLQDSDEEVGCRWRCG